MFCIECGKEIPDGVKFCPDCGASQIVKITEEKTKKKEIVKKVNRFYSTSDIPELKKLTVSELKEKLNLRNLPTSGNKSELIRKLLRAPVEEKIVKTKSNQWSTQKGIAMSKKKALAKKRKQDYSKMTVVELKQILKSKKLPVSGTKQQLIEKLTDKNWAKKYRAEKRRKQQSYSHSRSGTSSNDFSMNYVYAFLFIWFILGFIFSDAESLDDDIWFVLPISLIFIIGFIHFMVVDIMGISESNKAKEAFKSQVGYNKTRKGEVKNECRECGKVWFFNQEKLNNAVDVRTQQKHHAEVAAPTALAFQYGRGTGPNVLNQGVVQSMQMSQLGLAGTNSQIENMTQCPNCKSNNVKRT